MISDSSERVTLTMNREFLAKVDGYCDLMGLTRSAFCVFLIAQGMFALDSTRSSIDEALKQVTRDVKRKTVDMSIIEEMKRAAQA